MTLIVCIIVIMNDAIHDEIVVLSSERVEISEFLFEETPSTQNSSYSKRVDASELRRRRIARIVGAVAIFFIVFSCVLLGISFNMSDDINDKVRNSNSVLRKHNLPVNPQEHVTNESYFNWRPGAKCVFMIWRCLTNMQRIETNHCRANYW